MIHGGVGIKILITDISPAGNRDAVVYDKRLAVHAAIEAAEAESKMHPLTETRTEAGVEGIVNAYLDVAMGVQRG